MTDEKKKQYTLRISNANRTGLIVIIYDMLNDYMEDARKAAERGEEGLLDLQSALRHIRACVRELSESLDFRYSPSMELFSLYRYVDRELARAQRKNSVEPLVLVDRVMSELKEAFVAVAEKDTSPALMENAQVVYAGLTYGKNNLNVNLTDQGSDRGFRV